MRLIKYLLILLMLFMPFSCKTVEPTVKGDTVTIERATLEKVLDELIYQKQQLMECLEREKGR